MKQYRRLTTKERDAVILRVINRIESPELPISGPANKVRWERGWEEIYQRFVASDYDLNQLVPQYIHPKEIIRINGDYAKPLTKNFELEWYTKFRRDLFKKYLNFTRDIYEFGCGTGYNVVELARMDLGRTVHGLDWVEGPKKIIDAVRERYQYNVYGHVFDMFHPKTSLKIDRGASFLAIGALEQLGKNFEPFLQWVLQRKPAIFVHVDSLIELYNDTLFDQLAVLHDRKRNYLDGYVTRLRELEQQKKIQIIETRKSPFGSLFHDGYSVIVWRPL